MRNELSWTLGIATYNRRVDLLDCLRLALLQTRPPEQIVIVDASADWEVTREEVRRSLAPILDGVDWMYVAALKPSAAVQRNQCLDLATCDVVFLIDDDSMMFADCAAEIMKVYEADVDHLICGVSALEVRSHPDDHGGPLLAVGGVSSDSDAVGPRGFIAWVRRVAHAEEVFVPYDSDAPMRALPDSITSTVRIGRRLFMAGMTMTVRREPARATRFEDCLIDRGPEDSDISCRLARIGAIVTALDARLHHRGSVSGRYSPYSRVALDYLAGVVLHRLHSADLAKSRRRLIAMLRRRTWIGLLKDLSRRQWRLPNTRAAIFAWSHLSRVMSMSKEQVREWYPKYARQFLGRSG